MVSILNPILAPLLKLDPASAIAIISLLVSIISVLVYKFATNQEQMKYLKGEQQKLQKEMRTLRDSPEKMMKLQKVAMEKNMEYMKHSLKASLYTLIPMLLIFGWLNTHYAFYPLESGQSFNVTAFTKSDEYITLVSSDLVNITEQNQTPSAGKASWEISALPGKHLLSFNQGDQVAQHTVVIGEKYAVPRANHKGEIYRTTVEYSKLKIRILGITFTWFWFYFLTTIIFSTSLRKLLKVY
jgi:uncharacterized membrane protein (DUF106 family)